MPISILWGTRDGVIPRESFEALCVASGVQGTVVEGSHSWLIAEPEAFGEVITNDLRVAKAARELEHRHAEATTQTNAPKSRRRPARRVPTLKDTPGKGRSVVERQNGQERQDGPDGPEPAVTRSAGGAHRSADPLADG